MHDQHRYVLFVGTSATQAHYKCRGDLGNLVGSA